MLHCMHCAMARPPFDPYHALPWLLAIAAIITGARARAQDLAGVGQQKPIALSGSLQAIGGPYFYSGDGAARNLPWFWNANGNAMLSVYGWNMPFSFSVGSQQRTFTQPFNRYGASPYYQWVKLHAGYRTIRFNPYTLNGLQFLGGGIELDPKGFRFAAFYGRFNKPVAQDTLASITPVPAYKRMGYGVRVGVGSPRNHLDLMLVHVEDDSTSIPDPVGRGVPRPMENLSIGLSGRFALSKKLSWSFDAGASAITEDTRLPVNNELALPSFARTLYDPRWGSRAALAGNTGFQWTSRAVTLKTEVRQVDPGYRSLAAVYQQADVRSITVEPTIRFPGNKWRVNGSIGRQQDNVRGTKAVQSIRTIGSAGISWSPSRSYSADATFSNYGIQQQRGLQVLNDTFRVALANRSYGLSQRVMRANAHRVWTVLINCGLQQLQDLNPYGTFSTSENDVLYGTLYIARVRNRDQFGVNGGLNYSRNTTQTGSSVLMGPSLGFTRQFGQQKLLLSGNITWNKAFQDSQDAGSTLNLSTSAQFRISPSQRLQLSAFVLHNATSFVAPRQFTEARIQAGYTYLFRQKS